MVLTFRKIEVTTGRSNEVKTTGTGKDNAETLRTQSKKDAKKKQIPPEAVRDDKREWNEENR